MCRLEGGVERGDQPTIWIAYGGRPFVRHGHMLIWLAVGQQDDRPLVLIARARFCRHAYRATRRQMDLMIVIEDAIADAVAHAMVDGRAGHTGRNGLSPGSAVSSIIRYSGNCRAQPYSIASGSENGPVRRHAA
jgi:hypothetical protein